jgi:DNA-binding MarR family transcriptional regulator
VVAQASTPRPAPETDLFPDATLAPTGALLSAQNAVRAVITKLAVEPAGLDGGTADLLIRLCKASEHSIRGVEVGEQCHMSPTRVSRLVDRAEAAGLVERQADPDDRRAQQIALTPAGEQAAAMYSPLMTEVLEELVFETLTAEERVTLVELLGRVESRAVELLRTAREVTST